jgi:hypothetical protein
VRWQSETSGGAFSRFWQYYPSVSFKARFLGHLATYCVIKRNSLTLNISPLLPESVSTLEGARWRCASSFQVTGRVPYPPTAVTAAAATGEAANALGLIVPEWAIQKTVVVKKDMVLVTECPYFLAGDVFDRDPVEKPAIGAHDM